MTEMKAHKNGKEGLSGLIRKEIGSESNRRFLSRIPAFKADAELPASLRSLLGDLERAEKNR